MIAFKETVARMKNILVAGFIEEQDLTSLFDQLDEYRNNGATVEEIQKFKSYLYVQVTQSYV